MAKVNPAKAVALGIYHFNPERTHHYGDSHEKRIEEFEDIMKLGYFNTVHVNPKYINDDEFWRVIIENDATVWDNCWTFFDSEKETLDEYMAKKAAYLDILKQYPERWERFAGFHFDEPIWRGQSNADFLAQTKALYETYGKRIFPVFATGEFTDNEGNSMQIKLEAKNMKKVMPEALKYVTDVAFDSYSVDVREGYGNGSYIDKMHDKKPGIVDGKTYYSELADELLRLVGHEVNLWFFPTSYTTGMWRGGRVGEGFCEGHLEYMAELIRNAKHKGGLFLYTFYQWGNKLELGLQSHIVVKNEDGSLKLNPEQEKWWDYSEKLRKICAEFKETDGNLITKIEE